MYKAKSPKEANEKHTYAIYRDKKTKELRAVRTTHLYEKDKVKQIEQGFLRVEKFRDVKYPSGVQNRYTTKDVNGQPLKYRRIKAERVSKRRLPRRQAKRIREFAKRPWK